MRRANGIVPLRRDRVVLDLDLLVQLWADFLAGVVASAVSVASTVSPVLVVVRRYVRMSS